MERKIINLKNSRVKYGSQKIKLERKTFRVKGNDIALRSKLKSLLNWPKRYMFGRSVVFNYVSGSRREDPTATQNNAKKISALLNFHFDSKP